MMNEHGCGHGKRGDSSRMEREAKRAAWRARFAARRAGRGDWSHFKDPKFWGLDAESMKQWGFTGDWSGNSSGMGPAPDGEVEKLKAQVAEMEATMGSMLERISVLERLVLDMDKHQREARLAAEIEKLRDSKGGV
jgi:hypothetical protein